MKLKEMVESIDCSRETVGTVLQQAQIKPTLCPSWIQLFGLTVEIDGQGKILLIASSSGASGQVVKLRSPLLRKCRSRPDEDEKNKSCRGSRGSIESSRPLEILTVF